MKNPISDNYRVVLPDEKDYDTHLAGLVASFQPADHYEQLLVEEFAAAAWAWRRARAVETALLHQVGTSYRRGPEGIAEALFYVPEKHFRNHRRYMLDAERRYEQARRAVEEIRRRRERGIAASAKKRNEPNPMYASAAMAVIGANEPLPSGSDAIPRKSSGAQANVTPASRPMR